MTVSDPGGSAFQSEPGTQLSSAVFLRAIHLLEPVFGDGLISSRNAGRYQEVTPVDHNLGGSDMAFHVAFLILNLIAVFCILALFTPEFRLSFIAALAGGVCAMPRKHSL
jgi:hypothetical protein